MRPVSKPKAPPTEKQPPTPRNPKLGEEDDFGAQTFARGLKAVTEALEEVATQQALHHEAPGPSAKRAPSRPVKRR